MPVCVWGDKCISHVGRHKIGEMVLRPFIMGCRVTLTFTGHHTRVVDQVGRPGHSSTLPSGAIKSRSRRRVMRRLNIWIRCNL